MRDRGAGGHGRPGAPAASDERAPADGGPHAADGAVISAVALHRVLRARPHHPGPRQPTAARRNQIDLARIRSQSIRLRYNPGGRPGRRGISHHIRRFALFARRPGCVQGGVGVGSRASLAHCGRCGRLALRGTGEFAFDLPHGRGLQLAAYSGPDTAQSVQPSTRRRGDNSGISRLLVFLGRRAAEDQLRQLEAGRGDFLSYELGRRAQRLPMAFDTGAQCGVERSIGRKGVRDDGGRRQTKRGLAGLESPVQRQAVHRASSGDRSLRRIVERDHREGARRSRDPRGADFQSLHAGCDQGSAQAVPGPADQCRSVDVGFVASHRGRAAGRRATAARLHPRFEPTPARSDDERAPHDRTRRPAEIDGFQGAVETRGGQGGIRQWCKPDGALSLARRVDRAAIHGLLSRAQAAVRERHVGIE